MRRFYKLLKKLNKIKTDGPVVVRIVKPHEAKGLYGDCQWDGSKYVIRIVKCNIDAMICMLVHEFSHVIAEEEDDGGWHGPKWGVAYAYVWRVYCGEEVV